MPAWRRTGPCRSTPTSIRTRTRRCGACCVERQTALAQRYACDEFLQGLQTLGIGDSIPDFEAVNARLEPLTGWRIVGVPGLIPDAVFYDHLAHRRFPVTVWIRKRAELDYLVEPDLFHDFFGHVPLLSDPVFADYMQAYGQRGVEAGPNIDLLARPLLVHGRVRPDPHAQGPQGLRRRHPLLGRRGEARDRGQGVERLPFEPATRDAPALRDRQAAEHLFRARRFPPALRGGAPGSTDRAAYRELQAFAIRGFARGSRESVGDELTQQDQPVDGHHAFARRA